MINLTDTFEPVATVDVARLKSNLESIISIKNGAKIFAVVKSDAYGHGLKIAEYINAYCDGFCVSKVEEGQTLRHIGVDKTIMLLSPVTGYLLKTAASYNLTVPCYDLKSASEISELSKSRFVSVNMAVDTGMHRLGFDNIEDYARVLKSFADNKNIRLVSVYSHLACCCNDDMNRAQVGVFCGYEKLFKRYSDGFSHISASGGLLKGLTFDAVRTGILMYGYKPFDSDIKVSPIMNVIAKPSQVRTFSQSDRCLYNAKTDGGKYGLVNYGYADGLSRKHTPARCMDFSYEKVLSDGNCSILSDASVFAGREGTITYEILTNCATRLKKVYVNEI
ncbi:MAG: alanine racemase [Christensenellaceae bacterium]